MALSPLNKCNVSKQKRRQSILFDESPIRNENVLGAWNWHDKSPSPASTCSSPEFAARSTCESRRGRPRAEALTNLMIVGSTSPSAIKCVFCNRVFPREKSLQAHLRTHTGERPYACDYPGCIRAFTQSGQLRTHQRLHTGEKPFMCPAQGCGARFTHANRHCAEHQGQSLVRCTDGIAGDPTALLYLNTLSPTASRNHSQEVMQWLERYHRDKDKSPTHRVCQVIKKRTKYKSFSHDVENQRPLNDSSQPTTPQNSNKTSTRSPSSYSADKENISKIFKTPSKTLESPQDDEFELESDSCNQETTPRRIMKEQPKKRWLREAFQDASLWADDKNSEHLAQPIHWGTEDTTTPTPLSSPKIQQQRPTVLVCAGDRPWPYFGSFKEEPQEQTTLVPHADQNKWLGAMALMELATVRTGSLAETQTSTHTEYLQL